jgi:thiol-disulfide isomerase/thioredoxin
MKRNKKLLGTVLNIFLVVAVLVFLMVPTAKSWVMKQLINVGLFNARIKEEPAAQASAPVPLAFSFTDADGRTITPADVKGKIIFLNFWATWCPPCRAEMPSLQSLYNKLKSDPDISFFFISEDENFEDAITYFRRGNFTLPLVRQTAPLSPGLYAGTLPTTIILNREGRIVYRHEGMANYDTARFIEELTALK